jgi:hypothetical protein
MFRIMKGIDNMDWADFLKLSHYSATRQNSYKLYQPQVYKKIGQCSFINRATKLWNILPDTVVSAQTVQTFKSALVETAFYEKPFL